jgi:coenzyme F420-reducing hydrogenase delta subunit
MVRAKECILTRKVGELEGMLKAMRLELERLRMITLSKQELDDFAENSFDEEIEVGGPVN